MKQLIKVPIQSLRENDLVFDEHTRELKKIVKKEYGVPLNVIHYDNDTTERYRMLDEDYRYVLMDLEKLEQKYKHSRETDNPAKRLMQ